MIWSYKADENYYYVYKKVYVIRVMIINNIIFHSNFNYKLILFIFHCIAYNINEKWTVNVLDLICTSNAINVKAIKPKPCTWKLNRCEYCARWQRRVYKMHMKGEFLLAEMEHNRFIFSWRLFCFVFFFFF